MAKRTTTYLEWTKVVLLIKKLEKDENYKFMLLISLGTFLGLRISDILHLKWSDVLDKDHLTLKEGKTGKTRSFKINDDLKAIIQIAHQHYQKDLNLMIFENRFGTGTISTQYINRQLKSIFLLYGLKMRPSTHFMRKSFGRKVYSNNNESEHALVLLMDIFNHSSLQITKRYLGIRQEEIYDVYDGIQLYN
jgi:integrase